jgi:hypothetical protein
MEPSEQADAGGGGWDQKEGDGQDQYGAFRCWKHLFFLGRAAFLFRQAAVFALNPLGLFGQRLPVFRRIFEVGL